MVHNSFIKCQVCGSVTRVRLQVGHLCQHPIVITCGKCQTSLSGTAYIGQEIPSLEYEFDNADLINGMPNADFIVECSGEFPVKKQHKEDADNIIDISPFIRNISRIEGNSSWEEFNEAIARLNTTASKWKSYKKILNLFERKSDFLAQEIKKEFQGSFFTCGSESEILRSVHNIEVIGFYTPLKSNLLDVRKFGHEVLKLNPVQMKALNIFLNSHDGYHLEEIQSQIYKIMDEFINVFPSLIPAISLQYIGEDSFDFENEGSTTSTFDTVKQFYLDTYETLGNLMIIPVALNNIKYRGDIDLSAMVDSKVFTLEEYIKLPKANRYHFCLNNEIYTNFLGAKAKVNVKLRNAIGHDDIKYDPTSQLITYFPNPKDRAKGKTEYLLEFESEVVHMFQGILVISEYLYRLRELEMMHNGDISMIMGMSKIINVYDLCPCGSGQKFKFCHWKKQRK